MNRRKRQEHRKSLFYFAILILVSIAILLFPGQKPETTIPSLSLEGYTAVEPEIDGMTLYLSSECYEVSMQISDIQALAIENGLEGRLERRPLTQDIMKDMMDHFGIGVLMVKIESFDDGIYYAKLFMAEGNKILELDSRPSDAVAVAVRSGSPIYFKTDLLESMGVNTCEQK